MHAEGNPGFTYTIGAASKGIPDIIISCNISYKYASHILNQLCAKLRSSDRWFGSQSDILANGLMTYLLPCDTNTTILAEHYTVRNEFLFHENEFTRNTPTIDYAQLVMPDQHNRFPWDEEYNEGNVKLLLIEIPNSYRHSGIHNSHITY